MKDLKDIILEARKISGELVRVKKLFVKSYGLYLGGKSRKTRLDFFEEIIVDLLSRTELKFLIIRLQREYSKNSKK